MFVETITRKLVFEKLAKIPNRRQNVILQQLTSSEFTTLAVWNNKFVAFHKLSVAFYLNIKVVLVTPRSKTSLDFLNNLNFTTKIFKILAKYG